MTTYHDATHLIALLHSSDIQTVREMESFLREHLQNGKDSTGLVYALVDSYIACQDEYTVSLLELVEDPLDKDLSDRLSEHLKANGSRVHALNLLGRLVQRQPLWLPSIFTSGLFQALLRLLLKCEPTDLPITISGALLLCTLVPLAGAQLGSHLADICCLMVRMAAATCRRRSAAAADPAASTDDPAASTDDLPLLHLHAAVYSLFHRLYAVFPNYLLDYLRNQLRRNSREFAPLFNSVFRDLLSRVRAHPLLVTGSKEAELQAQRWRRVGTADLLLECGRYCLDLVETTAGEAGIQVGFDGAKQQSSDLLASSEASRMAAANHSQSQQLQASVGTAATASSIDVGGATVAAALSAAASAPSPATAGGTEGDGQEELMMQVLPEDGTFPSKDSFLCSSLVRRVRTRLYTHQPAGSAAGADLFVQGAALASLSDVNDRACSQQQQRHLQRHLHQPLQQANRQRRRSSSAPPLLHLLLEAAPAAAAAASAAALDAAVKAAEPERPPTALASTAAAPPCHVGPAPQGPYQQSPRVVSRDRQSYAELFLSALPVIPPSRCPECGGHQPNQYSCQQQPLPQCLRLSPADLMDASLVCSAEVHRMLLLQFQQQGQPQPPNGPEDTSRVRSLRAELLQSRCLLMYERHRRELHAQRNRRLLARLVRLRSLEAEVEDARRLGRSKVLQRVGELESCLLNERAEWQRERVALEADAAEARRLTSEGARDAGAAREEARAAAQLAQELRRLLGEERGQRMRAQARLEDAELELLSSKAECQAGKEAQRQLQAAQRRLLLLGDLLAKAESGSRQREAQLDELRFLRIHANRLEARAAQLEAALQERTCLAEAAQPHVQPPPPPPPPPPLQYAEVDAAELTRLAAENAELKRRLAAKDLDADLYAVGRIAGPTTSDCSCCPLVRMNNSL